MMRESEADGIDRGCVERGLAGNAANAVGSKKLLHELLVSVAVCCRYLGFERALCKPGANVLSCRSVCCRA